MVTSIITVTSICSWASAPAPKSSRESTPGSASTTDDRDGWNLRGRKHDREDAGRGGDRNRDDAANQDEQIGAPAHLGGDDVLLRNDDLAHERVNRQPAGAP